MLESLSFPKSLRNVPKYAATHHEHINGKGYPKGLTGDQIPLQGRIIAIADIFEALTATDRPYKKPMKLMKALSIMSSMTQEGQLDPGLYDVFINEKLYLHYSKKFLDPEQVDDVVLSEL